MTIITRKEYLERSNAAFRRDIEATTRDVHEHYYAQFVTEKTKQHVAMHVSVDELTVALREDATLNSIPLERWDQMTWRSTDGTGAWNTSGPFVSLIPFDREATLAAGETITRAALVCIAKEAARQLVADASAARKDRT